jgi:hypothetical protein
VIPYRGQAGVHHATAARKDNAAADMPHLIRSLSSTHSYGSPVSGVESISYA